MYKSFSYTTKASVPVSENLGEVPKHNTGQQDRVGRAVQGKTLILEHKPAMSLLWQFWAVCWQEAQAALNPGGLGPF